MYHSLTHELVFLLDVEVHMVPDVLCLTKGRGTVVQQHLM